MKNLRSLCDLLGVSVERDLPINQHVADSRLVEAGDLFYALPGERTHGVHFLQEVRERGAFAAVVPQEYEGPDYGLVLLRVHDVLSTLHDFAKATMAQRNATVIGVTGSVGKTTTKEFIRTILAQKFTVFATVGNQNTQISFPLSLLNYSGLATHFVLEMGMTEKGNIARLVNILSPHIVVMTPIGHVHFAQFSDITEIAQAKAEIFTPSTEFALVHEKAAQFSPVQEACPENTQVYPTNSHWLKDCPFTESHLQENCVAACKLAEYLGMSRHDIQRAFPYLRPFNHRFEKHVIRGVTYIDDAYNANYTSMAAALENLPDGERKIGVLGAMGDLGTMSYTLHAKLGETARKHLDYLLCIGKECEPMVDLFKEQGIGVEWFSSYDEMRKRIQTLVKKGDVVLIKGSNYHKLWELLPIC